jgi:branched-chain amino acid transport system permease protein
LLPALIGISLGRNPSGFLNDAFDQYGAMIRDAKPVFFAGVAAELLLWFLAFQHTIDNWTFVILTAVLVLVLPRAAAVVRSESPGVSGNEPRRAPPIELMGIDHPFTAEELVAMNRGVGFDDHRGFDRLPV